jgi:hypothetical protein
MNQNLISWGVFTAFVVGAVALGWHPAIFRFEGPMGAAKAVVWLAFLAFTAYSIYCSGRENIFRTIKSMARLHWGRQIGIDLYLGLLLSLSVIYLHEGRSPYSAGSFPCCCSPISRRCRTSRSILRRWWPAWWREHGRARAAMI